MKGIEILTLGSSLICLMVIPTFIGIKTNHPLIGIIIAFVASLSYLLVFAIKRK